MNEPFVATNKTIAWENRDFKKWHQGVEEYGFWAVMVNDSEWLAQVSVAQQYVGQYVHAGYVRQAHVSVYAGGLLCESDYSKQVIEQQKRALLELEFVPFDLSLAHLDSFTSAPYLAIVDATNSLADIKKALQNIRSEDYLENYCPHITLGLYDQRLSTQELSQYYSAYDCGRVSPLRVEKISFCSYQTSNIQGRITVLDTIQLN